MAASPTSRSLKALRGRGLTVAIVEKWNAHIKIRQDLFGFADLLAFDPGAPYSYPEITLIQTTTAANMSSRRKKIFANETALAWVKSGGKIEIHGWQKKAVGKSVRWSCKVQRIFAGDFPREELGP